MKASHYIGFCELQVNTRLPSSLLKIIDFVSQNPVKCMSAICMLCKEMKEADVTFSDIKAIQRKEKDPCNIPHKTCLLL